ncbi:uncharacterized protein PHALS_08303 [Plasmopara halstedii]|uniref:Uncharacterized protein n=1 Tax=Plasmopara halstedii TaxID=4781 RepID=A0A0P1ABJ8_PLAHL|nr:uncharacterized protein PHALS_08303 [Plasmopara halstedii]CEG38216.1 hypothetical protein PHALS_08303 [Plasmopara halstedii]|eukprot:XP_024574585.1 hypothetical protein PHALS_08303 [Plasmopara halstedii]
MKWIKVPGALVASDPLPEVETVACSIEGVQMVAAIHRDLLGLPLFVRERWKAECLGGRKR